MDFPKCLVSGLNLHDPGISQLGQHIKVSKQAYKVKPYNVSAKQYLLSGTEFKVDSDAKKNFNWNKGYLLYPQPFSHFLMEALSTCQIYCMILWKKIASISSFKISQFISKKRNYVYLQFILSFITIILIDHLKYPMAPVLYSLQKILVSRLSSWELNYSHWWLQRPSLMEHLA